MFITIQFKDAKNVFRGRTYDYELCADEELLQCGDIIRMADEDWNYICYGTRVKVVDVKTESATAAQKIHYVKTTM